MTLDKPKLSVIIPVSGEPERIQRLSSWFEPVELISLEVIVVEDSLGIRTQKELQNQLSKFPREYSLIRTAGNFGNPGDARNAGLHKVTGDWIAFWDSDDQPCLPTVAKILIDPESTEVDFMYTDFLLSYDDLRTTSQNRFASQKPVVNLSLVALEPGIWRFIFKRNILKNTNFPPFLMGEDQLFLANLQLHKRKGRYVQQNSYVYRKGIKGQLTESRSRTKNLEPSLFALFQLLGSHPSNFVKIVVIRQSLTLIHKGKTSSKILGLKILLKTLLYHYSWREFKYVLAKQSRKAVE